MMKLLSTTLLLLFFTTIQAQTSISGKVIDVSGNPIKDANVSIVGTTKGASTNANGEYSIGGLLVKKYYVHISYLGYASQTIQVQLNAGNNSLNFTLDELSSQLDEVIVSGANSRLENLQTTAAAISVVGTKEIARLQLNQISEINSIAPNFRTYDDGSNGGFTLFASRGISTYDRNPVIGIYIDDVPYFNGFTLPLALQDIEQIEVLRGPQGTLYGRNSLAGVIKVNTKQPTNKIQGYVKAGIGNLDAKDLAFSFNAPLVKDKLFLRASTNIVQRDGFVKNQYNNKDLQDRNIVDAKIRLKYLASDRLRFGLLYNVQRKESDAYSFVLTSPQRTLKDILEEAPFEVNFDSDVHRESTNQNVAFDINYDLKGFKVMSISALQHNSEYGLDEFDYSPFDIQYGVATGDINSYSQEFRFVSQNDSKLNWVGGILFYYNQQEQNTTFYTGTDIGLQNPSLQPYAPYTREDQTKDIQKGLAAYGQATYNFNNSWALTGGLRLDYEEVEIEIDRSYTAPIFTGGYDQQSADFDAITPKLALSYKANDNVFVFANFAKGFRPGGINRFVVERVKAVFENENSTNVELGIKTTNLDNRLVLNLTGFYTKYKDQQVFTLIDLNNFMLGKDNITESNIFGVELEAKANITRGLSMGLNFGYLYTEISEHIEYVPSYSDGSVTEIDLSGNSLPVSPEFNGSVNLNYIQPLTKKINLELSTDYSYQSDIYYDIANQMEQEAYGLLGGRLGFTSKNLDVFVWGKNLTDETYFGYGYGVSGFQAATFALPRTYGINLMYKF